MTTCSFSRFTSSTLSFLSSFALLLTRGAFLLTLVLLSFKLGSFPRVFLCHFLPLFSIFFVPFPLSECVVVVVVVASLVSSLLFLSLLSLDHTTLTFSTSSLPLSVLCTPFSLFASLSPLFCLTYGFSHSEGFGVCFVCMHICDRPLSMCVRCRGAVCLGSPPFIILSSFSFFPFRKSAPTPPHLPSL